MIGTSNIIIAAGQKSKNNNNTLNTFELAQLQGQKCLTVTRDAKGNVEFTIGDSKLSEGLKTFSNTRTKFSKVTNTN